MNDSGALFLDAQQHVRNAFALKGCKVDAEDAFGGITPIEGDVREYFEYPTAIELESFGTRERWLGTLVAIFARKTMRVGSKRR